MDFWEKAYFNVVFLLVLVAHFLIGCELNVPHAWITLKNPIPLLIGCFSQLILMPLIAYLICIIFIPQNLNVFAFGLFVTGCASATQGSIFWTFLLEANVNLSIAVTYFDALVSLVLLPFWIDNLSDRFQHGLYNFTLVFPYRNIVNSLVASVFSLLLGAGMAKCVPTFTQKVKQILHPFIAFLLLFFVVQCTITIFNVLHKIPWSALFSAALLPFLGFCVGSLISYIFGQSYENIIAIAIGTGARNTGIAVMLLKFSLSSSDAEKSILMPLIVGYFTLIFILFAFGVRLANTKWKKYHEIPHSV